MCGKTFLNTNHNIDDKSSECVVVWRWRDDDAYFVYINLYTYENFIVTSMCHVECVFSFLFVLWVATYERRHNKFHFWSGHIFFYLIYQIKRKFRVWNKIDNIVISRNLFMNLSQSHCAHLIFLKEISSIFHRMGLFFFKLFLRSGLWLQLRVSIQKYWK